MPDLKSAFFSLSAEKVIQAVEDASKKSKPNTRPTGRVLALNSLENRVYEIEYEDHSKAVAKFYRPNRWSSDQILDEHEFIDRLKEIEIPVVAPLDLSESKQLNLISDSLGVTEDGIYFAIFPKVRGRLLDELQESQLQTLGRYLARIHHLGTEWLAEYRLEINSDTYLKKPVEILYDSPLMDENIKAHYLKLAEELLKEASLRLESRPLISCHGDCHLGNVLWEDESAFLLDFDDMMLAPAVQDIWMVVRGRDKQATKDRETLLQAYEQMYSFDHSELSLIEPLRAIRIIYYSAWISQRWDDPSFPKAFPSYGKPEYWNSEMQSLYEIRDLLSLA